MLAFYQVADVVGRRRALSGIRYTTARIVTLCVIVSIPKVTSIDGYSPTELRVNRRRALGVAAGGLLGVGAVGRPMAASASHATSASDPVTMAMHLHGSFSEGSASMHAHLQQAQRVGVDVLWWTDHDFRVAALGYRRAVGFEGEQEPENGLSWQWQPDPSGDFASRRHEFVAEPHSPDEAGGALRFEAAAPVGGGWAMHLLEGQASRGTYSTSYADTVLELDVLAEKVGRDAEVVVQISSSYRPATSGRPAGRYRLQYRVGASRGRWTEDNGRLGVVGVAAGTGWQRLTMKLRADHAALWPDTFAGDASLQQLRVGVRVRRGASVSAVVDRLRLLRTRQSIADGMGLLNAAVREYRRRYPALTQYAASEVSLVQHLNAFGGDGTLPTYDTATPINDDSVEAQRRMVRFLHSHGSLVSINHPVPGPDLAHKLITTRGVGADVIEIGTGKQIEKLAPAFDCCRAQCGLPDRQRRIGRPRGRGLAESEIQPALVDRSLGAVSGQR